MVAVGHCSYRYITLLLGTLPCRPLLSDDVGKLSLPVPRLIHPHSAGAFHSRTLAVASEVSRSLEVSRFYSNYFGDGHACLPVFVLPFSRSFAQIWVLCRTTLPQLYIISIFINTFHFRLTSELPKAPIGEDYSPLP